MQVEKFLLNHWKKIWVNGFVVGSLLLCGYGVFIGRFLRFNSWDIVTKPQHFLFSPAYQIRHLVQNLNMWVFTVLFGAMLRIVYYTLQQMKAVND